MSKKRSLLILPLEGSEDDSCATFVLNGEGHTLGNALRYVISKNPEVMFCAYSVPHPSEKKVNLRIQTSGVSAIDVLRQGLVDLRDICDHMSDTFQAQVTEFKEHFPEGSRTHGVPGEEDS